LAVDLDQHLLRRNARVVPAQHAGSHVRKFAAGAIALNQRVNLSAGDLWRAKLGLVTQMVQVTYIEHDGTERIVDVPAGLSVMEGALRFRIPGIDGDCGGGCACATCHVYVDPAWSARLSPPNSLEELMLKLAVAPNAKSRLACQIKLTADLDGLVVRTPKAQY
jgi:2Fe-2S ferredoxin